MSEHEFDDDAYEYDLEYTRIERRTSYGGTWVSGTINGQYRFEALVFAEHAENPEWELGDSRMWVSRLSNKETSFNWDRGLDIPAASKQVQAIVGFLCAGLADAMYAE